MSHIAAHSAQDDTAEVLQVLIQYLEGRHYGDVEKLKSVVVTPKWSLNSILRDPERHSPTATCPAPGDQGEPFDYRIISVEVHGDHAVVMLDRPPSPYPHESIVLLRANGMWCIDALSITDTEGQP